MLNIWVVYRAPLDYPGKFVARRWVLSTPTPEVIVADTLEELRAKLPPGLHRMDRFAGDDPVIVESWI